MTFITTFTVRPVRNGTYFPINMLRHDCCFPADQDSAVHVGMRARDYCRVRLACVHHKTGIYPDTPRWREHQWVVEQDSIKTKKL